MTDDESGQTAQAVLTHAEQIATPTDPELIEAALDGDPEAILELNQRRQAVEHIVRGRQLLREADGA